jgi:hypothetical protein
MNFLLPNANSPLNRGRGGRKVLVNAKAFRRPDWFNLKVEFFVSSYKKNLYNIMLVEFTLFFCI